LSSCDYLGQFLARWSKMHSGCWGRTFESYRAHQRNGEVILAQQDRPLNDGLAVDGGVSASSVCCNLVLPIAFVVSNSQGHTIWDAGSKQSPLWGKGDCLVVSFLAITVTQICHPDYYEPIWKYSW